MAPATSTFHFSCLFTSVSQITGSLGFSLIRNHLLSPSDPNLLWGNANAGALLFCFICFQSLQMEVVTCNVLVTAVPGFQGSVSTLVFSKPFSHLDGSFMLYLLSSLYLQTKIAKFKR